MYIPCINSVAKFKLNKKGANTRNIQTQISHTSVVICQKNIMVDFMYSPTPNSADTHNLKTTFPTLL